MANTTPQAFSEFENKLVLTSGQAQTANDRRDRVLKILTELFPASSDMPLSGAYLIGSAARSTMIRPMGDVDVFAIFDDSSVWDSYRGDSKKLLYRVRNALDAKYKTTVVGSKGQAVRLSYNQMPHVEIAPAFPVTPGNSYYIPKGDGGWVQTSPFEHSKFLNGRNQELGSQLKPLTRILKRWNAKHSKRIGSFHLEVIVQKTFSTLGSNRADAVHKFFEWAPRYLNVSDPAGYGGDLSGDWSWSHRQAVEESLNSARERAANALAFQAAGDLSEASRLWRIIFGDDFPRIS